MAFPPLDHAFEKHVQDYLCSESYDFLKEVRRDATIEVAHFGPFFFCQNGGAP